MAKRAGRPRNPNARRRMKGTRAERVRVDLGTEELRLKKLIDVGAAPFSEIGKYDQTAGCFTRGAVIPARRQRNPEHSALMITRMMAYGLLTEAQCEAGVRLGLMHMGVFGDPHARISRYRAVIVDFERSARSTEMLHLLDEQRQTDYTEALDALTGLSRKAYRAVYDLAVLNLSPEYISLGLETPQTDSHRDHLSLIIQGLTVLDEHFARRRRRGNAPHKRSDPHDLN